MTQLPSAISLHEVGPREGFQFEKGPIATDRKIDLVDALSEDLPNGLTPKQEAVFEKLNTPPPGSRLETARPSEMSSHVSPAHADWRP